MQDFFFQDEATQTRDNPGKVAPRRPGEHGGASKRKVSRTRTRSAAAAGRLCAADNTNHIIHLFKESPHVSQGLVFLWRGLN